MTDDERRSIEEIGASPSPFHKSRRNRSRKPWVTLLDMRVWSHGSKLGHRTFVRGAYPNRVWGCARHDCRWSFDESCPICDHDDHRCPACGEPIGHNATVCTDHMDLA